MEREQRDRGTGERDDPAGRCMSEGVCRGSKGARMTLNGKGTREQGASGKARQGDRRTGQKRDIPQAAGKRCEMYKRERVHETDEIFKGVCRGKRNDIGQIPRDRIVKETRRERGKENAH